MIINIIACGLYNSLFIKLGYILDEKFDKFEPNKFNKDLKSNVFFNS